MRESSPGRSRGTASRGRPLRPEVFPDEVRQIGVPTIAGQVPLHPLEELRGDPAGIATDAAEYLARHAHGWWLHIDLDVLAGSEFPACDAATDPAIPGGLTWTELVTVTTAALRTGGCRGCSIGVYNTDLDSSGHAARASWPSPG